MRTEICDQLAQRHLVVVQQARGAEVVGVRLGRPCLAWLGTGTCDMRCAL